MTRESNLDLSVEEAQYKEKLEEMSYWDLEKLYDGTREAEEFYRAQREAAFAKAAAAVREQHPSAASDSSGHVVAAFAGEQQTRPSEEIEALKTETQSLRQERDALRTELGELRAEVKKEEPLKTRERTTAHKLVLGLAIIAFRYDPTKRSSVPKEIADDLLKFGISVSDDTVRLWLNRAYEEVGLSSEVLEMLAT